METEKFKGKIHDFDRKMEPQRPMFKFAKEYMKFVAFILMFLRATREGNWKLHLESLKALCKYFFAHDRLNYVRMVPLYLAQMELLESTDPDIHEEFMSGNFCVNKNDIPFCSIGPELAIEHVNKTTKIRFDPATSRYGKMVSYRSRIESPGRRSRGHSWITNAQLDAQPWFVRGCYYSLRGDCEEPGRCI